MTQGGTPTQYVVPQSHLFVRMQMHCILSHKHHKTRVCSISTKWGKRSMLTDQRLHIDLYPAQFCGKSTRGHVYYAFMGAEN